MKRNHIYLISILFIIVLWMILALVINHSLLLPSPLVVFKSLVDILTSSGSLIIILYTTLRLLGAILFSSILAIFLGILSGFSKKAEAFIKPYITILRTIPVISIVVIMLILFGFMWTPYLITFFMVFPIIYQATYQGIISIDRELIDVYHLEKHNRLLSIKLFYLPSITKYIYLSFLQSFGLGIKVLVMAEYLSQTKNSIGNAIYLSKVNLKYDVIFAWTILLIILSVMIEYFIQKALVKVNEKNLN